MENSAELVLSPEGNIYFDENCNREKHSAGLPFDQLKAMFNRGSSEGLLYLGIHEFSTPLPPSFLFWHQYSRQFISQVCKLTPITDNKYLPCISPPSQEELQYYINHILLMKGVEYLNAEILTRVWKDLENCLRKELEAFEGTVQEYLARQNPRWNLVGRVCFHLAENKNDPKRPFAFLATYTSQLSEKAVAQHLPLKNALQNYSGQKNSDALLALLLPVQKAANQSTFIKSLVDSGNVFQPMAWAINEAHQFLKEIPLMESSGIMVRVPNWWNSQKPTRPRVQVTLGQNQNSVLGLNSLLDFQIDLTLTDGQKLTEKEWGEILKSRSNLIKIKETWVEVDQEKLKAVLEHWHMLKKTSKNGLSMAESLRLLAGGGVKNLMSGEDTLELQTTEKWSNVIAGDWLRSMLEQLRNPDINLENTLEKILEQHLHATLRPYQLAGVQWLWFLYQLKLGGCLADDMGLGKTIQILSLLLIIKYHPSTQNSQNKPHLLVVPASLLGNWHAEIKRFSPSIKVLIAHSMFLKNNLQTMTQDTLQGVDVVFTTYGNLHRMNWIKEIEWNVLILDEAQTIKNPYTKQTLAVKELKSDHRLTLTGTPIENKLTDLWSLFDFTSPGLLGSAKTFTTHAKNLDNPRFISTLRNLTQPYILRRLKTDKKIISDLPDKTELKSYCSLCPEQIKLYQQTIDELKHKLENTEGIDRKGLIFSYLLRFKQICNHPTQWLGYGEYDEKNSGKFARLKEICEEIAAKQEKVLVFTQFREIIPALSGFLKTIFGREGLELHGATAVKKRGDLVADFQREQGPPFFVLSIKAGGTGLNLTKASHVIHFDRWWNPAVENQATDRAYRIGQKHPVLVHKFICLGTIEEKIDAMITSKTNLSQEMLKEGSEYLLTELSNDELIDMVTLDIDQALGDL